eukprot:360209-Chlamydomonas_euryale.AAC.1
MRGFLRQLQGSRSGGMWGLPGSPAAPSRETLTKWGCPRNSVGHATTDELGVGGRAIVAVCASAVLASRWEAKRACVAIFA